MRFVRNLSVVLATGFILFFFSERLFWTAFRPGDGIGDLVVTWLAYSVLACVLVNVVFRFTARTAEQVFLAGAVYGWLAEGALVGTLYGTEASSPFPLSIICTGLSWHALISVLVGWHFLRRSLDEPRPWKTLSWSVGIGVFWGLWAPFLWRETPPVVASLPAFAVHSFSCTVILMLSYGILFRVPPERNPPGWMGLSFSALVLGVFYVQQIRALGILPLIILPLLVGGILLVLWKAGRRILAPADDPRQNSPPWRNLLFLMVIPLVASALYALQLAWRTRGLPPTVIFGLTALVSVLVLIWSLVRLWRPATGRCRALDA